MAGERERPLHNFTLPQNLKWGSQKQLRCIKNPNDLPAKPFAAGGNHHQPENQSKQRKHRRKSQNPVKFDPTSSSSSSSRMRLLKISDDEKEIPTINTAVDTETLTGVGELRAMGEKIINDLKTEGEMIIQNAIRRGKQPQPQPPPTPTSATTTVPPVERPWNLRTRKVPVYGGSSGSLNEGLFRFGEERKKKGILGSPEKELPPARPKFSLTLSKKEIEEDIFLMTGMKPSARPKRSRPKAVQRQINNLFPGSWLTEVTADAYKVNPPVPENNGKKH